MNDVHRSNYTESFKCSHHAGSVKVLGVLRLPVQGQEGVGVTRRTVTQPVALLQQAAVPHHLATLQRVDQVLRHSEGLGHGMKWREKKVELRCKNLCFCKSKC